MADEQIKKKVLAFLQGKWVLLLLAVLGILLLLFGGSGEGNDTRQDDSEAYRLSLQKELTALCSQVDGVGRVSLLLTLEGGTEAVYAQNTKDGSADYLTSGGKGLLLYERKPCVRGVGVVCEGGDDPTVRRELCALLSATLSIGTNRIYISCG